MFYFKGSSSPFCCCAKRFLCVCVCAGEKTWRGLDRLVSSVCVCVCAFCLYVYLILSLFIRYSLIPSVFFFTLPDKEKEEIKINQNKI